MTDTKDANPPPSDDAPDAGERLALPLLIPVIAFLFAILIIYGLSRIYLELNDITIGTVTMATPLAIGVSLYILFAAWYMASNRRVPMWQTTSIGMVAVVAVTGGAIWAAVDDRGEGEAHAANGGEPTPTAPVEEGQVLIGLTETDWVVSASPDSIPAGEITFAVSNEGNIGHNLRIIKTDLPADALPLDSTGLAVDEGAVNVVAQSPELRSGETDEIITTLEAGSYVLICNIAGHYDAGMNAAFTVQ
ncbi:MAG: hypothetical protein IIB22_00225 [Chloroflexi bacterium]|nr:hypothetical protein [Chloroflexota bacterium]